MIAANHMVGRAQRYSPCSAMRSKQTVERITCPMNRKSVNYKRLDAYVVNDKAGIVGYRLRKFWVLNG